MSPGSSVAPVLPGETLGGKYRIERVLGRGGMGIVVAARHLELDERVAIKFLLGERSEGSAERFLREGRAAAKVKGEHVCRVFDFGRLDTGEPYLVMEYLEGSDLARQLEREGPQPSSSVVGWVIQACDALADAHALGIVHRDLKPANLFLANRADGSSCAKVLDFGISKLARAETMTGPATTMGSPVYMSPEQMESARDVDARSDVWSLGVLMYELIAGKPPFVGESMVQLSVLVRERREEPLETVVPEVPEGLARVITRCLEKKPDARFASVANLACALAPYAPPEVSALIARLVRRSNAEPAIPLAMTAPDPERETPLPALAATVTSPVIPLDSARGTFAPIHGVVGEKPRATQARRWASVATVAGAAALVALGAGSFVTSSLKVAPSSPASTQPPATIEVASVLTMGGAPTTTTTTTTRPDPAAVPAPTAAPPRLATVITPPTARPTPVPTIPNAAAAGTTTAAAAAVPVLLNPAAPAPPAPPSARRRELDRDDP